MIAPRIVESTNDTSDNSTTTPRFASRAPANASRSEPAEERSCSPVRTMTRTPEGSSSNSRAASTGRSYGGAADRVYAAGIATPERRAGTAPVPAQPPADLTRARSAAAGVVSAIAARVARAGADLAAAALGALLG